MRNTARSWLALLVFVATGMVTSIVSAEDVLVRVNGETITQSDWDFLAVSRRIPQERRDAVRDQLLEILIERQLMRTLLKSRGVEIDAKDLDSRIARLKQSLQESGEDPNAVLNRIGMSEERLQKSVVLRSWRR